MQLYLIYYKRKQTFTSEQYFLFYPSIICFCIDSTKIAKDESYKEKLRIIYKQYSNYKSFISYFQRYKFASDRKDKY